MSAFPAQNAPDQAELLRRYLDVAEDFAADLVEEAVTLYITGAIPGFDGRFAPTPPMLASACRKAAEHRARKRYLDGLLAPRLPAPVLQKTPEQRQSVRQQMEAAVDNLAARIALDDAEAQAAQKAMWEKTNERFRPDMSDDAVMNRLIHKRPAFTAGSPESDEAAA